MKNKMKYIFRSLVAGVLVAMSVFSLASCNFQEVKQNAVDNVVSGAEVVKDKIGISLMSTEYIKLAADETVDEDYSKYPAQKLTATVSPATLSDADKLVDWSVDWIDNKTGDETAVASDYIKVVPTADGSTEATVICVKPFFDSSVGVKVTTRVGGYSALCTVTYIGTPTYLGFFNILGDGDYSFVNNAPVIPENKTTSFKLNLDNALNSVGSTFGNFEVVKFGVTGECMVRGTMLVDGTWAQLVPPMKVTLDNFLDVFVKDVSIEQGNLVIKTGSAVNGFVSYDNDDNTARYEYVSGAENIEFYVTVRDTVSGVNNTLYFTIASVVESVSLNTPSMSF